MDWTVSAANLGWVPKTQSPWTMRRNRAKFMPSLKRWKRTTTFKTFLLV